MTHSIHQQRRIILIILVVLLGWPGAQLLAQTPRNPIPPMGQTIYTPSPIFPGQTVVQPPFFPTHNFHNRFLFPAFGPGYLATYYLPPSYYDNAAPLYPPMTDREQYPTRPVPAPAPAPTPAPAPAPAPVPVIVPEDVAEIDLTVPTGALVWFNGIRVKQTGAVRLLVTPALKVGVSYTYDIRAAYSENGKEVTTHRKLTVRAGDRLDALLIALPVVPASTTTVRTER
jgi:uncharacterized protein (TIGR03000 family)